MIFSLFLFCCNIDIKISSREIGGIYYMTVKQQYHISADGQARKCNATKRPCRLGGSGDHFNTLEEAQASAAEVMERRYGTLAKDTEPKDEINYDGVELEYVPDPDDDPEYTRINEERIAREDADRRRKVMRAQADRKETKPKDEINYDGVELEYVPDPDNDPEYTRVNEERIAREDAA